MKNLVILMCLVSLLFLVGCPVPESYVRSSELALENVNKFDANIDIFAKNYYTFIAKDTEAKVKAGKMTEQARTGVLKNVEEQMGNLKEQSVINKKFVILAHDQAHDEALKIEDILGAMKAVNEATPEVLSFIEKLKGD